MDPAEADRLYLSLRDGDHDELGAYRVYEILSTSRLSLEDPDAPNHGWALAVEPEVIDADGVRHAIVAHFQRVRTEYSSLREHLHSVGPGDRWGSVLFAASGPWRSLDEAPRSVELSDLGGLRRGAVAVGLGDLPMSLLEQMPAMVDALHAWSHDEGRDVRQVEAAERHEGLRVANLVNNLLILQRSDELSAAQLELLRSVPGWTA